MKPLAFHPTDTAPRRVRVPPLLRWLALAMLGTSLAVGAGLLPGAAFAASTDAGAAAAAAPRAANRLKVGTLVEFDPRRNTVGDAIKSLLEPVQYRLTVRTVDPLLSASVLRRPIPAIAANAGVMSIESALLLLIGEDNRLVVDHVNRLIAIERMPDEPPAAPAHTRSSDATPF